MRLSAERTTRWGGEFGYKKTSIESYNRFELSIEFSNLIIKMHMRSAGPTLLVVYQG